jgi:hypothetical protein
VQQEGLMIDPEYFEEESYDNATFVRVVQVALFYTAEYYIKLDVRSRFFNGKQKTLFESEGFAKRPTRTAVIEWRHQLILEHSSRLEKFDIDVNELYRSVGGDPRDLYG